MIPLGIRGIGIPQITRTMHLLTLLSMSALAQTYQNDQSYDPVTNPMIAISFRAVAKPIQSSQTTMLKKPGEQNWKKKHKETVK